VLIWVIVLPAVLVPLLIAAQSPFLEFRQPVYIIAGLAGIVGLALLLIQPLLIQGALPGFDVLLFRSPTPFSIWGGVAMWGVFATILYAALRKPFRLRPERWRQVHLGLAAVIAVGTVVHAVLIEGTMGQVSKGVLCALVITAVAWVIWDQVRQR